MQGAQHPSVDLVIPVYNNATELLELLPYLKRWVTSNESLSVIIVDDGSRDHFAEVVPAIASVSRIKSIRREVNGGRAAACNTGIFAASADFVAILDVDCRPDSDWLERFSREATSGADCVFSNLAVWGQSFWARYTNNVYENRGKDYVDGAISFSTQFCLFRRSVLCEVGGFYEGYKTYGFEDRDLINSLLERFPDLKIRFLSDLYAYHEPENDVEVLTSKMYKAGRYTSRIYKERFHEKYRCSQYYFMDYYEKNFLQAHVMECLVLAISFVSPIIKKVIEIEYFPFSLRRMLAKGLLGSSFFLGTRDAAKS